MGTFFAEMGVMRWPLLLATVFLFVQIARAAWQILGGKGSDAMTLHAVLVWGALCALLGLLGTVVGMSITAGAIEVASTSSPGLIWGGMRVALTTTVFGLLLLALALLAWLSLYLLRGRRLRMDQAARSTVLTLLVCCTACGPDGDDPPVATVRDSAGIRIVEIPESIEQNRLQPQHVADLVPPDGVLPAMPWGVAADPSTGSIYVADRLSDRVVVFDGSGGYVGVIGRPGEGPGEFRNPSALYLGTDEVLRVWDTGRGVISRWAASGEFLGEERPEIQYWGPGFRSEGDRLLTVTNEMVEGGMGMEQRLELHRGGATVTLHNVLLPMELMELPCMTRPGPTVFAPSLNWASRGERTFVHRGPGFQIDVFEDTQRVASIRRPVSLVRVTEALAAEAVKYGPTPYRPLLRSCDVTPLQVVRAVGHEEYAPSILALAVGPEGGVWVTRTEDGINPSSVDVLGPDGTLRFTVDVQAAVIAFPSPSSFLTIEMDRETDATRLSLYTLGGEARNGNETGLVPGPAPSATEADGPGRVAGARTQDGWTRPPGDEQLEPGDEFRDCPTCPLMVVVPPGRYVMGSPEGEGRDELAPHWHHLLDDEYPQVEVVIDYPLAVGKYEVTFDEWERCRDLGACTRKPDAEGHGKGHRPVINVGREDAQEYLDWLSRETGATYRLPSEAEWEYVARAGSITARYWGEEIGEGRAACTGCGGRWNGRSTAPVGSFPANGFGLHDVLGNAAEWTSDCYIRRNDAGPNDGGPVREASPYWENGVCTVYVYRGGGWRSETYQVRAGERRPYNTRGPWGLKGSSNSGFRVFRELDVPAENEPGRP